MTLQLSYKNIAIVGLPQAGVVAAVLGSGSPHRMSREFGIQLPAATKFAGGYGLLALALPVAWVVVAVLIEGWGDAEPHELLGFASGILVLVVLLIGAFQAAVVPWVRLLNPCCSLSA